MSKKNQYKNLKDVPAHIPPPPLQTTILVLKNGPFDLDWRITFGKFKHRLTLRQAIDEDPDYISWCLSNIAGFILTPAAQEHLLLALEGE